MSDPAIWIAVVAALLSCYFAAVHLSLKSCSRARLTEVLGITDRAKEAGAFLDRAGDYLLMTGTLRACLILVILLAVLNFVERAYADRWGQVLIYVVSFAVAGTLVSVFTVAIPLSFATYLPEC